MTTDELRAKFENWWLRNGDPFDLHKVAAWEAWQAAHASRDAEVEALRYGLSEARDGWYQANGVADLAIQHRDAAEAEVEALRKDAERYRWLRERVTAYDAKPFICIFHGSFGLWNDEYADCEIDAAMQEESK